MLAGNTSLNSFLDLRSKKTTTLDIYFCIQWMVKKVDMDYFVDEFKSIDFMDFENSLFSVFLGENPQFCAQNPPKKITIYFCILIDDGMDGKVDMDYFVDKSKSVDVE